MENTSGISGLNSHINEFQRLEDIKEEGQRILANRQVQGANEAMEISFQGNQGATAMGDLVKGFKDVISTLKTVGDKVRQS